MFGADEAWRMPFLRARRGDAGRRPRGRGLLPPPGAGLPYVRATVHMLAFAALGLAAVMAVYFVGDAAG